MPTKQLMEDWKHFKQCLLVSVAVSFRVLVDDLDATQMLCLSAFASQSTEKGIIGVMFKFKAWWVLRRGDSRTTALKEVMFEISFDI